MKNTEENMQRVARLLVKHRAQTMTTEDRIEERVQGYKSNPKSFSEDFQDLVAIEKLNPDGTAYDWGE